MLRASVENQRRHANMHAKDHADALGFAETAWCGLRWVQSSFCHTIEKHVEGKGTTINTAIAK